ncbi:MAG TPA: HEAT repeat domain-containing protein, partial [Geminicoccaceae bacterium]
RVAPPDGETPPNIRLWAEPGSRGVWFATKTTALVCLGPAWYQVKKSGDAWKLGVDRPDLPLAYCGSVGRLADATEKMLAGETTPITVIVYGATDVDTSFDLALGRNTLPGLAKVQRVRASLNMAPMVAAASGQDGYVIGPGTGDASNVPALLAALKSADTRTRAEAAEEIGNLGKDGREAAGALEAALVDGEFAVRNAAAAGLLRVLAASDARQSREVALNNLKAGLIDTSAGVRRDTARQVALAGPAAAALAGKLLPLLTDADEAVKAVAIQTVTTIGPSVSAGDAKPLVAALVTMLGDARWRVEAADALGRIGDNARPVPMPLIAMLKDPQKPVQWAAVRAMAQIGGDEAKPAVDYIKTALPGGSEVEQYDMMIYLALLGPTAADAAPTIRANRIKNPVLPSATLWAIGDTTRLPWEASDDRRLGPGGGPGGGGGPMDRNRDKYSAYNREQGDRLKPAAQGFAKRLLDGTAGTVPEWGYALLKADLGGSIESLTSGLANADRQVRQRAAVAIGFLGADAESAKPALQKALDAATDGREQRMLK